MNPRVGYAIAGLTGAILTGGLVLWLNGRVRAEAPPPDAVVSENVQRAPAAIVRTTPVPAPREDPYTTRGADYQRELRRDEVRRDEVRRDEDRRDDERASVPLGTALSVTLRSAVDSGERRSGDRFEATLDSQLRGDGRVVASQGAAVSGRVIGITAAGRTKGREEMILAIDRLETVDGTVDIGTNDLTFVADSTETKDAVIIGGAAAAGAIVGAVLGGGKGATKGAAVGGVGGIVTVLATKGGHIHLEGGRSLVFELNRELVVEGR